MRAKSWRELFLYKKEALRLKRNSVLVVFMGLSFTIGKASADQSEYLRVHLRTLKSKELKNIELVGRNLRFQGQVEAFRPVSLRGHLQLAQIERETSFWKVLNWRSGQLVHELVPANILAVQGEGLHLNEQPVPERLLFFSRTVDKEIEAVAVLHIEDYLRGVLASEMPASWPLEALKAQAVASRSYALYQRNLRKRRRYHLESSVMDQVFNFERARKIPVHWREKIRRAVNETRGEILVDKSGEVLPAYFHADSGGHTEEAHNVWRNNVFLGAVRDIASRGPHSHWRRDFSAKELVKKLRIPRCELKDLQVESRHLSGRAQNMKVICQNKNYFVQAQTFRRQLGFFRLKSTWFDVEKVKRKGNVYFSFHGRGFGHGVGMSQWGARKMAQEKRDYRRILHHYYPRAELSGMKKRFSMSSVTQIENLSGASL